MKKLSDKFLKACSASSLLYIYLLISHKDNGFVKPST